MFSLLVRYRCNMSVQYVIEMLVRVCNEIKQQFNLLQKLCFNQKNSNIKNVFARKGVKYMNVCINITYAPWIRLPQSSPPPPQPLQLQNGRHSQAKPIPESSFKGVAETLANSLFAFLWPPMTGGDIELQLLLRASVLHDLTDRPSRALLRLV